MMATPHPGHEPILELALRAPSAHNAQAWRLVPIPDGKSYELHYDYHEYLPHDPDDRDAYLAMGAFFETLRLAADARGMCAEFDPVFRRRGSDLLLGSITITTGRAAAQENPLAAHVAERHTNRAAYRRGMRVPEPLLAQLRNLGCVTVAPRRVLPLAIEASVRSWSDRQFVTDLRRWVHFKGNPPAGMTCTQLQLSWLDRLGLRFAFRAGCIRRPFGLVYASRELRLTLASSTLAVLCVEDVSPSGLFEAGRRLLLTWVAICAAGWSCHPISIVIDRPETAPRLAHLVGRAHPVALFRVGWTSEPPQPSSRRTLDSVLRDAPEPRTQAAA